VPEASPGLSDGRRGTLSAKIYDRDNVGRDVARTAPRRAAPRRTAR